VSASRTEATADGTGSDGRGAGRVRRIEARLAERYGEPEKPRVDPLDELVHTILSQNTTDVNRDRAWDSLWEEFDGWAEVRDAPAGRLEEAIRVAGLATQKAATIQGVLERLEEEAGGPSLEHLREMGDDEALDYLAGFRGVGVKTAACVLCFSLRRPVIPVDTHVHRVARRLGLVPEGATRDAAHRVLNETVPPALRFRLHIHLIRHGRATCTARRAACGECVLEAMCPKVGVESAA
jgi:endonuclease-3